jgi:hypothetical protein
MGARKIRKKSMLPHRVITEKQWQEKYAQLDDIERPIIVKYEECAGLLQIRAKTTQEAAEAMKRMNQEKK